MSNYYQNVLIDRRFSSAFFLIRLSSTSSRVRREKVKGARARITEIELQRVHLILRVVVCTPAGDLIHWHKNIHRIIIQYATMPVGCNSIAFMFQPTSTQHTAQSPKKMFIIFISTNSVHAWVVQQCVYSIHTFCNSPLMTQSVFKCITCVDHVRHFIQILLFVDLIDLLSM